METYLPSEVARLVLGYIYSIKSCACIGDEFLAKAPQLEELCSMKKFGCAIQHSLKVNSKTLVDVLLEYCSMNKCINERFEELKLDTPQSDATILKKLHILLSLIPENNSDVVQEVEVRRTKDVAIIDVPSDEDDRPQSSVNRATSQESSAPSNSSINLLYIPEKDHNSPLSHSKAKSFHNRSNAVVDKPQSSVNQVVFPQSVLEAYALAEEEPNSSCSSYENSLPNASNLDEENQVEKLNNDDEIVNVTDEVRDSVIESQDKANSPMLDNDSSSDDEDRPGSPINEDALQQFEFVDPDSESDVDAVYTTAEENDSSSLTKSAPNTLNEDSQNHDATLINVVEIVDKTDEVFGSVTQVNLSPRQHVEDIPRSPGNFEFVDPDSDDDALYIAEDEGSSSHSSSVNSITKTTTNVDNQSREILSIRSLNAPQHKTKSPEKTNPKSSRIYDAILEKVKIEINYETDSEVESTSSCEEIFTKSADAEGQISRKRKYQKQTSVTDVSSILKKSRKSLARDGSEVAPVTPAESSVVSRIARLRARIPVPSTSRATPSLSASVASTRSGCSPLPSSSRETSATPSRETRATPSRSASVASSRSGCSTSSHRLRARTPVPSSSRGTRTTTSGGTRATPSRGASVASTASHRVTAKLKLLDLQRSRKSNSPDITAVPSTSKTGNPKRGRPRKYKPSQVQTLDKLLNSKKLDQIKRNDASPCYVDLGIPCQVPSVDSAPEKPGCSKDSPCKTPNLCISPINNNQFPFYIGYPKFMEESSNESSNVCSQSGSFQEFVSVIGFPPMMKMEMETVE